MNAQSRVTSCCDVVIPPLLLRGMLPLISIMTLCLKIVFICERHFDDEFLKKNKNLSRFSMEKNPVPTIVPGRKKKYAWEERTSLNPFFSRIIISFSSFFVT